MKLYIRIAYAIANQVNKFILRQNLKEKKKEENKWNKLFKSKNTFIFKLNDTLSINLYKDSKLSNLIYKGFEQEEILFLRKYLKQADTFIDIGSNIGLFSLHAAQIVNSQGKVYAFEPTPSTNSRLIENIELNKFQNIINANAIGLSSKKGKLELNISTIGYDAWNTFAQNSDTLFQKKMMVSVQTLDNFLTENNITENKIKLVKIDVEGWEIEVLKGAVSLLSLEDAPVFMIEFTEENLFAAGANSYELYDLLVSFGYSWYIYDSKMNKLFKDPKRMHYPYNNLFAIKNIEKVIERIL